MLMIKETSVNFKGILGNIFTHSDNYKAYLQKLQCSKWSFQFPDCLDFEQNLRKQRNLSKDYQENLRTFEIFYIEKAVSSKH